MSQILEFFDWLRRQLIDVEEWTYFGIDFTGDPDLPLPKAEDWDEDLGKTHFNFHEYYDFIFMYVLNLNL